MYINLNPTFSATIDISGLKVKKYKYIALWEVTSYGVKFFLLF